MVDRVHWFLDDSIWFIGEDIYGVAVYDDVPVFSLEDDIRWKIESQDIIDE